jgi:4-amino-4-deoxy-L-arabinose transferase-like glycosyltransferase
MTARRSGPAFALLAAVFIILSLYYWIHKPLTPALALSLLSALGAVLAAALLTLAAGGAGRRALRGLPPLAGPGERAALQAAFGFGLLALAGLALGLARLYFPWLLWILLLAALVWLRRDARGWARDIQLALKQIFLPDALGRWAAMFVIFTLGLGALRALAPPVMWDALAYHLTLPKLYLQTHGLRLPVELMFSGMPQNTEMLYTLAMGLRGVTAAQMLGWSFGALLALGLAAYAHEVTGSRGAVLAPALLFSGLSLALELSWAYSDLLLMLLALAVLIAVRQWRISNAQGWLGAAGALAGLAVGCKYTGILIPFAACALLLWPTADRRPASAMRRLAVFGLSAFGVFLPWLLKNWLFTGSPVFPLLWPTAVMDAARQWFYNRPDLADHHPAWAALILLRGVFLGVQGGNDYDATVGPLVILLPLILALAWRRLDDIKRGELRPLAVFLFAGYAGWVGLALFSSLGLQTRLFFPFFPALALLGAAGLAGAAQVDLPRLRVSFLLSAAVALALGLSALENAADFAARSPLAYLTGAQSAADFRGARLGWYAAALDRVNALPAGARVLFLWEARSLECLEPARCQPDEIIDRWWRTRHTLVSASNAIAQWRAAGFTHVLLYETGMNFVRADARSGFSAADWAELEALRAQLRPVENIGGAYTLYQLP